MLLLLLTTSFAIARPQDKRDTCGGQTALTPCGGIYPSDFCCPTSAQCLRVNATVLAVICCPSGRDCRSLQPTTCELSAYDASKAPLNQVHIQSAQNLTSCGSACCPPGFECKENTCLAIQASTVTSSSTVSTATATQAVAASNTPSSTTLPEAQPAPSQFSGSSFAAGFIPGIVLGILLVIAIFWIRKRRRSASPVQRSPDPPVMAISRPTQIAPYRTDFLRNASPVEQRDRSSSSTDQLDRYSAASTDLRPMLDFDYQPPRSPSPAFLNRALSFRFSPQGKLRNKKSMHSLRRHMDAQASEVTIDRSDSGKSTGTIKVAIPKDSPWHASARPDTPTRTSRFLQPPALGSPYSPSRYGDSLIEPHRSERRVTTFSSLMEKAGFRRREFEDI